MSSSTSQHGSTTASTGDHKNDAPQDAPTSSTSQTSTGADKTDASGPKATTGSGQTPTKKSDTDTSAPKPTAGSGQTSAKKGDADTSGPKPTTGTGQVPAKKGDTDATAPKPTAGTKQPPTSKGDTGPGDEADAGDEKGDAKDAKEAEKKPETETPEAATADQILKSRPFVIKACKHDGTDNGQVTGSILSQSLDKMLEPTGRKDVEVMTLAALRKLVPRMSRYAAIDKFCTPSGTIIDDETISLIDYLKVEGTNLEPASAGTATLKIFFRATGGDAPPPELKQPIALGGEPAVKAADVETPTLLTKSEAKQLLETLTVDGGVGDYPGASLLNESQWAVVLRNCSVFYGWILDPRTKRLSRAPKPAFRLRSKVNEQAVAQIPDFATSGPVQAPGKTASSDKDKEATSSAPSDVAQVSALTPKPDQGIPNFRVNDDSRIEVTAHEDELTVSMARSDFSEQSTEVTVSASGWGVSASASFSHSTRSSNASSTMNSTTNKTLIARYLFPRCDIILWPNEMEPTPELAELLETVRTTKSIKALRRLHSEFGNLFCQRLTLGGRLLSTKVISINETKTMEEHKQSFKTAVGAEVGGGAMGFSASVSTKHEEAGGSATSKETSSRTQNEAVVFEGVGGDTILAVNPAAWAPTVGNHELWRVINRDGLSLMSEVLSQVPGYAAVQSWFVQAVPAMNRYMTLDETQTCKARFRVTSPSNSLSMPNLDGNVAFYLGHKASSTVTPRLNSVSTWKPNYWTRIDMKAEIPIFNPATYRAPTIIGYDKFTVGGTQYGAAYNAAFVESEWDIIAPFDNQLKHGTRVILRSCPFKDATKQDGSKQDASPSNPSHMVVYRNAQGEFLPAMSDSDEYQYWRILKSDLSEKYIRPGDEVKLCWNVKDQTTGWRDFTEDVFGRRQVPAATGSPPPLFMKVPWPRFEKENTQVALIMSSQANNDLAPKALKINNNGTPATFQYCLQDLKLRIDNVTNEGRGDSDDYMMQGVKQANTTYSTSIYTSKANPFYMMRAIFWMG